LESNPHPVRCHPYLEGDSGECRERRKSTWG
jgi:hypothetical protein